MSFSISAVRFDEDMLHVHLAEPPLQAAAAGTAHLLRRANDK